MERDGEFALQILSFRSLWDIQMDRAQERGQGQRYLRLTRVGIGSHEENIQGEIRK